jgi:Ca2+-dependent lipid-binding protein
MLDFCSYLLLSLSVLILSPLSLLFLPSPVPFTHILQPFWYYFLYPFINQQKSQGYGRLKIRIVEAKNLMASDFNLLGKGTSDPYVLVKFGTVFRAKHTTKIINKSLNPRWNENFEFVVHYPESVIRLEVYDHDALR